MIMCASCVTRSAFPALPLCGILWHSVTVPAAFDLARINHEDHIWNGDASLCNVGASGNIKTYQNISHSIRPVPVPLVKI